MDRPQPSSRYSNAPPTNTVAAAAYTTTSTTTANTTHTTSRSAGPPTVFTRAESPQPAVRWPSVNAHASGSAPRSGIADDNLRPGPASMLSFLAQNQQGDTEFTNEKGLGQYLELRNGIPGHDTIRRVVEAIDPKRLEGVLLEWIGHVCPALGGVIAIDGKRIRGSGSTRRGQRALHVVSAYASEMGLVLGQQRCEEKSNEITAIEALLPNLALSGCIMTIDAMGLANTAWPACCRNWLSPHFARRGWTRRTQ